MNKLFKTKVNFLVIFVFILFLFKLPNFYLIPILKASFLTTHVLARGLLFLLFILNIKKITYLFSRNKIFFIVLLLFLIQSFSILQSFNTISFLSRYKELIVGFMAFYTALLFRKKYKILMDLLLITTILSVLIQLVLIIFPDILTQLFSRILYYKLYDLVVINLARGRTYFETFDEIVIPIIFYLLVIEKKHGSKKFVLLFLFIIMTSLAIISGWRIRLAMLFFGSIASAFFVKDKVRYIVVLILSFSFLISLFNFAYKNNTFTRLELTEENTLSLESRIDQLSSTLTILEGKPLGIGLGNYYDYLPGYAKNSKYLITGKLQQQQGLIAEENVHNIFGLIAVESGIPAIIIFITLLLFFVRNDYCLIRMKDYPKISFMIGFWIMFIYSFFNPLIPGVANYLFWFLRGYSIMEIRK